MSRDLNKGKGWFTTYSTEERLRKAMSGKDSSRDIRNVQPVVASSLKGFRDSARTQLLRLKVFTRDIGICSLCGIDTISLSQAMRIAKENFESGKWNGVTFAMFKKAVGKRVNRWPRSLWEMDHIKPVSLGGRDSLKNLRTLCIECHLSETNRLIHGKGKA